MDLLFSFYILYHMLAFKMPVKTAVGKLPVRREKNIPSPKPSVSVKPMVINTPTVVLAPEVPSTVPTIIFKNKLAMRKVAKGPVVNPNKPLGKPVIQKVAKVAKVDKVAKTNVPMFSRKVSMFQRMVPNPCVHCGH
jgi:hypothetical protein